MRKVLAALLMLVAIATWAQWMKVDETQQQVVKVAENKYWNFYVDRPTIVREGQFRIVSEIWDMKETPKQLFHPDTRSRRAIIEYDCEKAFFRGRKMTAYSGQMGTGQILREAEEKPDPKDKEWLDAMMSMPGASVVRLVCSQ